LALGERSNLRCGVVLRSDLKRNEPDLAPQSDQWPGSLDFTQEKKQARKPLTSRSADNMITIALTGPAANNTWGLNDHFYPYCDP
jgi:hypothetical protein